MGSKEAEEAVQLEHQEVAEGGLAQQAASGELAQNEAIEVVEQHADNQESSFALGPNRFFFASIEGEEEAENQKWPIALYYCLEYDRDQDQGKVGWYDRTWTTAKWPSRGQKPGAVFRKYLVPVPLEGGGKAPKHKPEKTWNIDTVEDLSRCTLPINLDAELGTVASTTVKVPAPFMDNKVVPAFQGM